MFNFRTLAIIKRELKEKLLSKTFVIMTILLPVMMFGFIFIQTYVMNYQGGDKDKIVIASFSDEITSRLTTEMDSKFQKNAHLSFEFKTMDNYSFTDYLKKNNENLSKGKISGLIYIPKTALKDKNVNYYSKTPKNFSLLNKLRAPINKVLVEVYFIGKNIPFEELAFARDKVDIKSFKISENKKAEEEGFGNLALAYLFTFLLYISLLMIGSMVMQSVIQEKANRIVEVLLSSVTSKELMMGKIFGAAITGIIQMAIWLSPVILVISTTWFALPKELTFSITIGQIGYLLVNFFIGLLTFVGLFATVGSIFEEPQDAQSGMWPVMLLIIIPFLIAMAMMQNPENQIAKIASMFPFAAIIVMPTRMTLMDVPAWQFVVSFLVNIGTVLALFPIAGKIYRVGILMTGKKPKWSEVIKWFKYKY